MRDLDDRTSTVSGCVNFARAGPSQGFTTNRPPLPVQPVWCDGHREGDDVPDPTVAGAAELPVATAGSGGLVMFQMSLSSCHSPPPPLFRHTTTYFPSTLLVPPCAP